jgi:hypothetical protein
VVALLLLSCSLFVHSYQRHFDRAVLTSSEAGGGLEHLHRYAVENYLRRFLPSREYYRTARNISKSTPIGQVSVRAVYVY